MSAINTELKLSQGLEDDLRQSFVICKNEMKKFLRGKKFMIFGIIMLVLIAIETIVPYVLGDGYDGYELFTLALVGTVVTIIELAGVLFTSTSIVSEFQDRTALILFTKPVRKRSIYFGKLIASLIIIIGFTLAYYVFTAVVTLVLEGGIASGLGMSLVLAVFGIYAVSGLAMLVSSFAKNGGTAIILTLLMLMLILSLVASLLDQFANIDSWWCITAALGDILNSLNITIMDGGMTYMEATASQSEILRSIGVLVVWGTLCNIAGYFIFRKRDF